MTAGAIGHHLTSEKVQIGEVKVKPPSFQSTSQGRRPHPEVPEDGVSKASITIYTGRVSRNPVNVNLGRKLNKI